LVTQGRHLLHALDELGYCKNSGFGAVALDFNDIKNYTELTGDKFNWWEVSVLRSLSRIYATEINNDDKQAYAPYQGEFSPKSFKTILHKFKQ